MTLDGDRLLAYKSKDDSFIFYLNHLNLSKPHLSFFESFLTNKQHFVNIFGIRSNTLSSLSGVPQDRFLLLILF